MADDLGWADTGCFGNRYNETPAIDRLAREGVRFTQFYAGPVCSPTRANLQSGQDQARFGITQHIPGHRRSYARLIDPVVPTQLPLEVETFAERLRDVGYATGYFGKWHLGQTGFGPHDQGWETAIEHSDNIVPPQVSGSPKPRRTAEFLTEKAVDFITANQDRPFLLQVSHYAVHIELSTTPKLLKKYQAKPPVAGYPSRPEYAGLLEELDRSIGRIADTVDRLRLARQTLIFFVPDNGRLEHEQSGRVVTSNQPLRGEKGSLYEGGTRVPAVARWPGRIPAGGQCDTPLITMDFYPTVLELVAVEPPSPERQPLHGSSFAALLENPQTALGRDALHWHLPHYHHRTPASSIRRGDWKLIEFFETGALELYNLHADPGEQMNVVSQGSQRGPASCTWRSPIGAGRSGRECPCRTRATTPSARWRSPRRCAAEPGIGTLDPALTERLAGTFRALLGESRVGTEEPSTAGEYFSRYGLTPERGAARDLVGGRRGSCAPCRKPAHRDPAAFESFRHVCTRGRADDQ